MKYNEFISMIQPFLNSRGNSFMFPKESLETTINVSIQQIYNEYRWQWLLVDEEITVASLGDYYKGTTSYPIKYPIDMGGLSQELYKANLGSGTFLLGQDYILVSEEGTYDVSYLKGYNFLNYSVDGTQEIPLPTAFIPALFYLVLSQIDQIDVQQLQGQTASNFSKYQYEISNLKLDAIEVGTSLIGANPQ